MERLPRPELPPPVNNTGGGKIKVIVSGGLNVTSSDVNVEVVRKE